MQQLILQESNMSKNDTIYFIKSSFTKSALLYVL